MSLNSPLASLLNISFKVAPTAINSLKDGFQLHDLFTIGKQTANVAADEFLGPFAPIAKQALNNLIIPGIVASLSQYK